MQGSQIQPTEAEWLLHAVERLHSMGEGPVTPRWVAEEMAEGYRQPYSVGRVRRVMRLLTERAGVLIMSVDGEVHTGRTLDPERLRQAQEAAIARAHAHAMNGRPDLIR